MLRESGGTAAGLNRSSQRSGAGGCDDDEATVGRIGAEEALLAWAARGGEAGGPATVLAGDRGGALERGRGPEWRCLPSGGIAVVPGGGRHATIPSRAIGAAAIGAALVGCGARGDRAAAGPGSRPPGDRPTPGSRPVCDLARAAARELRHGVPRQHGAVARPGGRRGGRRRRGSRRTTLCAAMSRIVWRGGSRGATAFSSMAPSRCGRSGAAVPGSRAAGHEPGARSRSRPRLRIDPRTLRCASPTRPSLGPFASRAAARLAAGADRLPADRPGLEGSSSSGARAGQVLRLARGHDRRAAGGGCRPCRPRPLGGDPILGLRRSAIGALVEREPPASRSCFTCRPTRPARRSAVRRQPACAGQ
jgi:hypothetical protein